MRRLLAAVLLVVASMVGAVAVDVAAPSVAGAYTEYQFPDGPLYRDWGWLNSINGGVHVYAYDYCAISLDWFGAGLGCRQWIVDEDIWGYGVFNAVDITMPWWFWVSFIGAGTPYVAPAVMVFDPHPALGSPQPWNNTTWTNDDPALGCVGRRWCGSAWAAGKLYQNFGTGQFFYGGANPHNTWLAQFHNQWFTGGYGRALIYFGVV